MNDNKIEKCVIIGSGPAGHTAATYAGRALLKPIMYEGFMAAGVAAGGQLTTTTEVENYPGFPNGISGPELMVLMRDQSEKSGTTIVTETISNVDLSSSPYQITNESGQSRKSLTIIIATGATAKRLEVPGSDRLWQKGISACAVCDGALPVFRDKNLIVVGGGDTAAEEATFLTKFGTVTMLVRRNELRASQTMQNRILENKKINILWDTVLTEVLGEDLVVGVRVRNVITKEVTELEAGGLFFAIGHEPNTSFLDGQLETDNTGYLITGDDSTATNKAGIFACGDVQDKIYRQAITAAGSGCMAALEAERYLSENSK